MNVLRRIRQLAFASLVFATGIAAAAGPSAVELAQQITEQVISAVAEDAAIKAGDTERAVKLVEERVLPYFNFRRMTALAVGRDWRGASEPQREALTGEFRTLLVRTYSNALTQYDDQTIHFKPYRGRPDDEDALVRTEIRKPGAQPIEIDFSMEKVAGDWKVFDVVVAGVSLVTNYRASFKQQIQAGGIDGLIKSLRDKNGETAAKAS